jgi:hypothetical protein
MVELLGDPVRRAQMGEFGRRRVENELAWCYEAPKLLAAYDAIWCAPGFRQSFRESKHEASTFGKAGSL